MKSDERALGYKQLASDNWLEADEATRAFGRLSLVTGDVHPLTAQELAESFLAVNLSPNVPQEIVDLFNVARGSMLYGFFFYPLYALGQEQLWRVCDAALAARFEELGGPKSRTRFAERIKWMVEAGNFTTPQETWWTAVKDLRNSASHPSFQMLSMPTELLGHLRRVSHAIGYLFDESLDFMTLGSSYGR